VREINCRSQRNVLLIHIIEFAGHTRVLKSFIIFGGIRVDLRKLEYSKMVGDLVNLKATCTVIYVLLMYSKKAPIVCVLSLSQLKHHQHSLAKKNHLLSIRVSVFMPAYHGEFTARN